MLVRFWAIPGSPLPLSADAICGWSLLSQDCSTSSGVSTALPTVTSSLQISSAKREASTRSTARSFSFVDSSLEHVTGMVNNMDPGLPESDYPNHAT